MERKLENAAFIKSNMLKMIAILTMTIDHIGAVLFPCQMWLRYIGRLAFPIFCFLIVEGYFHTRNVKKYLSRLFLFALISEIPFDLTFKGKIFDWSYQNVFWTLFLGLLAIYLGTWLKCKYPSFTDNTAFVLTFLGASVIAFLASTDYNAFGVWMIAVFFLFRNQKLKQFIFTAIIQVLMYPVQLFALFAFIPIFLYNGKKGIKSKVLQWTFYVFYPVHLLIIYGINLYL